MPPGSRTWEYNGLCFLSLSSASLWLHVTDPLIKEYETYTSLLLLWKAFSRKLLYSKIPRVISPYFCCQSWDSSNLTHICPPHRNSSCWRHRECTFANFTGQCPSLYLPCFQHHLLSSPLPPPFVLCFQDSILLVFHLTNWRTSQSPSAGAPQAQGLAPFSLSRLIPLVISRLQILSYRYCMYIWPVPNFYLQPGHLSS